MCSHIECVENIPSLQEKETEARETSGGSTGPPLIDCNATGSPRMLAPEGAHAATESVAFCEDPSLVSAPSLEGSRASICPAEDASTSTSDLSAESVADIDEVVSREDVGDSTALDGRSTTHIKCSIGHQERSLERCNSESSLVTSEHVLKHGRDDSCNGTGREELDDITNMVRDSSGTGWTDDKHNSYLSSMEATFVKNMYDREYCSLDLCGHAPRHSESAEQDSVEYQSRVTNGCASSFGMFMSWQQGGWRPVTFTRPLLRQSPNFAPLAVLTNPWIKHFRAPINGKVHVVSIHHPHTKISCATNTSKEAEPNHGTQKVVSESLEGAIPNAMQGSQIWQQRFQSHLNTSSCSPAKSELDVTVTRGSHTTTGDYKQRLANMGDQMGHRVDAQYFQPICLPFQTKDMQSMFQKACVEPTKQDSCRGSDIHNSSDKRDMMKGPGVRPSKMQRTERECECDCLTGNFDQVVPHVCSDGAYEEAGGLTELSQVEHHQVELLKISNCSNTILTDGKLSAHGLSSTMSNGEVRGVCKLEGCLDVSINPDS